MKCKMFSKLDKKFTNAQFCFHCILYKQCIILILYTIHYIMDISVLYMGNLYKVPCLLYSIGLHNNQYNLFYVMSQFVYVIAL